MRSRDPHRGTLQCARGGHRPRPHWCGSTGRRPVVTGGADTAAASPGGSSHQVAIWGASPLSDRTGLAFVDHTFRDVVHTDVGGSNLRIRLSNAYGRAAVTFTDVAADRVRREPPIYVEEAIL